MGCREDRPAIRFEIAPSADQARLSRLALSSKAVWGYDSDFLQRCKSDLTVPLHSFEKQLVKMAFSEDQLIGFYSFSVLEAEPSLNFLFLLPSYKGKGFGRILFEEAVKDAVNRGWISFLICSDPHASPFYTHLGAILIGSLESPVEKGRFLPVLRYLL